METTGKRSAEASEAQPEPKRSKVARSPAELRETGLSDERERGIRSFLGDEAAWFAGTVKQRFEDFLVYEVTPEGKVVRITDTTPLDVSKLDSQGKLIVPDPSAAYRQIEEIVGADQATSLRYASPLIAPCSILSPP